MPRLHSTPESVHRRRNPLTGEWVLVSPHRGKRPWQGQSEAPEESIKPSYDPNCYLCPNNQRISGERNPGFSSTYVFTNDFAALQPMECVPPEQTPDHPANAILRAENVAGTSRVVCFSPDHSKSLPEMSIEETSAVVQCWHDELDELSQSYTWVQVFENKGSIMGCSQPHPHGQIWASNFVPTEVRNKDTHQKAFMDESGRNLLLEYLEIERQEQVRVVVENNDWIAVVPYWAAWPFETLLAPKRHITRLNQLNATEKVSLAEALRALTIRYDNVFKTSFPYSMGWHFAPFWKDGRSADHWQLHACFYPPLLRSASVKKFMVGYEMLAEPQRDLTAEQAATTLRAQGDIHYKSHTGATS